MLTIPAFLGTLSLSLSLLILPFLTENPPHLLEPLCRFIVSPMGGPGVMTDTVCPIIIVSLPHKLLPMMDQTAYSS